MAAASEDTSSGNTSSNGAPPTGADGQPLPEVSHIEASATVGAIELVTLIKAETAFIAKRRAMMAKRIAPAKRSQPEPPTSDKPISDFTGLALSGGGIRSASFCLGVVQALNVHRIIERLDYLSCVSGGGYLGASLLTTLAETKGEFVYDGRWDLARQKADKDGSAVPPASPANPSSSDLKDSLAVQHLRNYSNYLVPHGTWDYITSAAIYVRGLAANIAGVLLVILAAAIVTVVLFPTSGSLDRLAPFTLTRYALVLALALFFGWSIIRSLRKGTISSETNRKGAGVLGAMLVAIAALAFVELQPIVLKTFFFQSGKALWTERILQWLAWASYTLAPLAAGAAVFWKTLKRWLEDTYFSRGYAALMARGLALVVLWAGALALPLVIWIVYLNFSAWIIADTSDACSRIGLFWVHCKDAAKVYEHGPYWMQWLLSWTPSWPWLPYLLIMTCIMILSAFLRPNAYTLHSLYRDRLARAFLFDPKTLKTDDDPRPVLPLLSSFADAYGAPYPLINTTFNVFSPDVNRRGRNADFFLCSPLYIGSRLTGYVPTAKYREHGRESEKEGGLYLETVMAISGAAASSSMGARTIRALAPTLALLNVRLGYWLKNPSGLQKGRRRIRQVTDFSHRFLLYEMFGLMDEKTPRIYLSDGGHIENLGIYELLRRRAKVIIAVDAEADPQLRFGSFITLQIYARIDLGVRIELPYAPIREATLAAMGAGAPTPDEPAGSKTGSEARSGNKAHVAVGRIDYGDGHFGVLVYIKASLTGDENDYIRDYGRRNPAFPHESTGDQFFTEEQFEVYRALGFHITDRLFAGKDKAMVAERDAPCEWYRIGDSAEPLDQLRKALALD